MAKGGLAYRSAKRHVKYFDKQSKVLKEHYAAMECVDCEAFLQLGIDAFEWLVRADETIREAVFSGKMPHSAELETAIEKLFVAWQQPCRFANLWIQKQQERGFNLENLDKFQQCEEEVRAIVRSLDDHTLKDPLVPLRDEALAEHANGQTAEFV